MTFGVLYAIFSYFWAIFGVGIRFKYFWDVKLWRLWTFWFLKVHTYFFFILPFFGIFWAIFWFYGAIFWFFKAIWGYFWGWSSITFFGPTNVDYRFLFWKYSPIILFLIQPYMGPFIHYFGPSVLFLGLGQIKKPSRQLLT